MTSELTCCSPLEASSEVRFILLKAFHAILLVAPLETASEFSVCFLWGLPAYFHLHAVSEVLHPHAAALVAMALSCCGASTRTFLAGMGTSCARQQRGGSWPLPRHKLQGRLLCHSKCCDLEMDIPAYHKFWSASRKAFSHLVQLQVHALTRTLVGECSHGW